MKPVFGRSFGGIYTILNIDKIATVYSKATKKSVALDKQFMFSVKFLAQNFVNGRTSTERQKTRFFIQANTGEPNKLGRV